MYCKYLQMTSDRRGYAFSLLCDFRGCFLQHSILYLTEATFLLQYLYLPWCLEWCWNTDCSYPVLVIALDGSGQVTSTLHIHKRDWFFVHLLSKCSEFEFSFISDSLLSRKSSLPVFIPGFRYVGACLQECWAGAWTMRAEVGSSSGTRSYWEGLSSNLTPMNLILSHYKVIYKDVLCTNSEGDCECGMLAESEDVEERALRTNVPTLDHVPQCGRWWKCSDNIPHGTGTGDSPTVHCSRRERTGRTHL